MRQRIQTEARGITTMKNTEENLECIKDKVNSSHQMSQGGRRDQKSNIHIGNC